MKGPPLSPPDFLNFGVHMWMEKSYNLLTYMKWIYWPQNKRMLYIRSCLHQSSGMPTCGSYEEKSQPEVKSFYQSFRPLSSKRSEKWQIVCCGPFALFEFENIVNCNIFLPVSLNKINEQISIGHIDKC